jgi:CheY-like chemotaxis protein
MRILVADDSPSIRLLVGRMCADAGHQAVTACSLAEVVAVLADRGPFDAAAIDLRMPEPGDGIEAVARCKGAGIPHVVIITGSEGDSLDEARTLARAHGVSLLKKPFMVGELMRALGIETKAPEAVP